MMIWDNNDDDDDIVVSEVKHFLSKGLYYTVYTYILFFN